MARSKWTLSAPWRAYWYWALVKTVRSMLIWPPITGTIALAFNIEYAMKAASVWQGVLPSYIYAYSICIAISGVYCVAWAIATHIGGGMLAALKDRIFIHVVVSLFGVAVGIWLADVLCQRWLHFHPSAFSNYLADFTLGTMITVVLVYFYAYRSYLVRNRELERANVQAELSALKAQMHPHFLFNSLNSLAELIVQQPEKATQLTEQLARLYRSILDASREPLVALEKELDIVRTYLSIEKVRLGDRLQYHIENLADTSAKVPSLSIQTLVENAVKHGVSPAIDGGEIRVACSPIEGGAACVEVVNTGAPFRRLQGGTGLENTEQRLALSLGSESSLEIGTTITGATRVSFLTHGAVRA